MTTGRPVPKSPWLRPVLCLAFFFLTQAAALGSESSITLKEPLFRPLPSPPAPVPKGPKSAFKEALFPLSAAENYQEVMAAIGPLSPLEAEFLGKNRFLLKPRPARPASNPAAVHDEMLAEFDNLGGPLAEHLRRPEHARFVGPDIFIHAFSRYLTIRQAAAETGPMLELLRQVTEGLYYNAAALRAGRTGQSAIVWEKFMAQLLVPLLILGQTEGGGADISAALTRLDARGRDLSPALTARVRTELRRIYQEKDYGLPGLIQGDMDYAVFRPQGYYAATPEGRAYFRAATWFQRLGWDPRTESAEALNFALALSHDPPARGDPRPALTRLLEISDFFYGPARTAGWAEWTHFLMKEAGVPEFTADIAAEAEVLNRLQAAALKADLFPAPLVQILPRRLNGPQLLSEELAGLWPNSGPPPFSALWLPVLWRHGLAEETIGRQLALSTPEPAGNRLNFQTPAGFLEKASLKDRSDDYWFSSLATAWWPVWTSLTGRYGLGRPLYMRSWPFAAKELETILGGLADLPAPLAASTAPVPGRAGPASPPRPEMASDQPQASLVKGFVEPNPVFWRQMIRLVRFTMAGFQHFELFPEDLKDGGALIRFLRRLERAAEISDKELAGEALSEDDYEFIRLFHLDWIAAPHGQPGARSDQVFAVSEIWPSVFGATAEPWLILVLVGNENSPRLTLGLAYNHYEFISDRPRPLVEELWRESIRSPDVPLPPKNFWYESLWPREPN